MYKVIIIDDNRLTADSLGQLPIWETMGCQIAGIYYDGLTGKNAILKEQPEIILSDIHLPGMSGLEMMQLVKEALPETKVIFMSAYDDFSYIYGAMRLKAEDYLLKPFLPDDLKKVVEGVLQSMKACPASPAEEECGVVKTIFIQPVLDYISEHSGEHITAEDTAAAFYMSVSKLNKLLQQHTGCGFRELLIQARMECAKKLLLDVHYTVENVATLVGYKNYVSFYRAFTREFGISPSEYKSMAVQAMEKTTKL